jgi:hypothetical protein
MARGHLTNILKSGGCSAATLLTIAVALDVTTDWLLTGEGPIDRHVPRAPAQPAARKATPQPSPDHRAEGLSRSVEKARAREAAAEAAQRPAARTPKARS